ncbi:MAG: sigma 54-interacting transcriptional regulator [Sterolibacterium sp.]
MFKEILTETHIWRDDGKLPIVTFVIHDRLEALVRSVIPHYATKLDIRIVSKPLDRLPDIAHELSLLKDTHVLLGSDLIEASCEEVLGAPMISIQPSLTDVMHALIAIQPVAGPIRIVMNRACFAELDETRSLFNPTFTQHSFRNLDEARNLMRTCATEPDTVVIGDSIAIELAEKAGLRSFMGCSQNTIRVCLENAIALILQRRTDDVRQERLALLTRHLSDGIMSIDARDRIVSINPAMATMLGVPPESTVGRMLAHACASLSAIPLMRHEDEATPQVCRIRNRYILVSRFPLHDGGREGGSTFVCSRQTQTAPAATGYRHGKQQHVARYRLEHIVGESPAIKNMRLLAAQYATVDSTVLITGESGTGKELFAQGIHNASRRHGGPFVAINCAALPESLLESELFGFEEGAFTGSKKGGKPGLFEIANGGTVFLDEIGDMPMPLQTRLLRVLQEREVVHIGGGEPIAIDIRVIAATNRELQKDVAIGRFRGDLYYRLNVCHLHLPPLRERQIDIPQLALFILGKTLKQFSTAHSAEEIVTPLLTMLTRYPWPGNIREMENVLERLAVCACSEAPERLETIGSAENLRLVVPELFSLQVEPGVAPAPPLQLQQSMRASEEEMIRAMLSAYHGNRAQAAKALGISRATLWRKLQRLPAGDAS